MATPSPGYAITVRMEAPSTSDSTARLSSVVAAAGGTLMSLDVVESSHERMVVEVSCDTVDAAQTSVITDAITTLDDFVVRNVSDRTFLMHLGGKIGVAPKISLRHRDDLSRAYPRRRPRVHGDRRRSSGGMPTRHREEHRCNRH
jgi:malate dehydrogenase (oxaloacetate-decarboxylating)